MGFRGLGFGGLGVGGLGFGVGLKVSLGAIGLSGWGPCNEKFNYFILDSQNSFLLRSRILDDAFRRMISPAPSALTCSR